MPAETQTRQNTLLLVTLLVGQLLLMTGSVRGAGGSTVLESWLMRFSSPFVDGGRVVGGGIGGAADAVSGLVGARGRNAMLESEVRRLREEVERTREASLENVRLRQLLGMREQLVPGSIAARVVMATLDGQMRMIVVDRGSRDGVRPEMAVVAWGGAVGRVLVADPSHAKIRLVTDPESGVAGLVQRSRARGLVAGTGGAHLEMRFVPTYADVLHGDRVVTSGLEGIFPSGFGLGRVSGVTGGLDGSQSIQLEPEIDFGSLEEVLILRETAGTNLLPPPDAPPPDPRAAAAGAPQEARREPASAAPDAAEAER